jgi:hypothetical protein
MQGRMGHNQGLCARSTRGKIAKKTTTYRFCDGASESSTKRARCTSSSADDMFRVAARDLRSCGVRNYALVGQKGNGRKEGSRKCQEERGKPEHKTIVAWGGPHHNTQSCAHKPQHTSPQLVFRVGRVCGLWFPAPLLFHSTGARSFHDSAFSPRQHLLPLLHHSRLHLEYSTVLDASPKRVSIWYAWGPLYLGGRLHNGSQTRPLSPTIISQFFPHIQCLHSRYL